MARLAGFSIILLALSWLSTPCHAALPVRVLAVSTAIDRSDTHFQLDLSAAAPFRIGVKTAPDRIEIDFPTLTWSKGAPESGAGRGFVTIYRDADAPAGGTRIILETTGPVRIAGAGTGLAVPGQPVRFDLDIVSADGSPPPATAPAGMQGSGHGAQDVSAGQPSRSLPSRLPLPDPPQAQPQVHYLMPKATSAGLEPRTLPDSTGRDAINAMLNEPEPAPFQPRAPSQPLAPSPPLGSKALRHVVAIDPGHGGVDPGTAGQDGTFEKDVTLASALALKAALEATGHYQVVMTRDEDRFIKLQDRVQIARQARAELFVSLHCDAMEGREAHGATIYTLSETASDAVSARLAVAENRADAIGGVDLNGNGDVANILIDLSMRDSMNQSNRFANLLVTQLQRQDIRLQELLPHRSAGFAVLKAADMPSVLIEMGYLSDSEDAALLVDPAHQKQVAAAIALGVDQYFQH